MRGLHGKQAERIEVGGRSRMAMAPARTFIRGLGRVQFEAESRPRRPTGYTPAKQSALLLGHQLRVLSSTKPALRCNA